MRSLISSTPTLAGGTADGRPVRKLLASTALACVMLSGCAGGKIFEPYDADKTSVSMDARQRVILSVDRVGPDGVKRRIVCAEPSPDTIAAAAASAGLSGGVSGIPEAPTLAADVAGNAARSEQAAYIGARNATIQLLRDGLYRACEAYMNGALGDFGYGLVLSNYGRVMTALLSAEGLTRPTLAPPVIIGSVSGPGSTNVNQQGGSRPAGATASGTTPAAGTADAGLGTVTGGSGSAATTSGGGTALQAIGEPTNGSVTGINDQAAEVFEKVILPLASPSSTPDGSFVEAAVGCMLWRDRTGLKEGTLAPGDPLAAMCDTIMTNMPRLAEDAVRMKMQIAQDQAKAEAVAVREEKVVARENKKQKVANTGKKQKVAATEKKQKSRNVAQRDQQKRHVAQHEPKSHHVAQHEQKAPTVGHDDGRRDRA